MTDDLANMNFLPNKQKVDFWPGWNLLEQADKLIAVYPPPSLNSFYSIQLNLLQNTKH